MGLDQSTKDAIFKLDYSLHSRNIKWYLIVGIIAHLIFFILLSNVFEQKEFLFGRIVCMVLYASFFLVINKPWTKFKIFLYEAILFFTLPVFFTFMMLYNDVNVVWATSIILATVIYGMLSKTVVTIPGYILGFYTVLGIYRTVTSVNSTLIKNTYSIELIAILMLLLVIMVKISVESTYNKHLTSKKETEKLNETFSSIIYIAGELSMYDDLSTMYHLLIDRLVYMFPEASLSLVVTRDSDYKYLNDLYHNVDIGDQKRIKEHFAELIDPYALRRTVIDQGAISEDLEIMKHWLVFNKSFEILNPEGNIRYDINIFLKNTNISDNEINVFNIFMEQFKGSVRTRFQAIELERYATTDSLTKLYNRNSYDDDMQETIASYDKNKPFSIVFGDINSLKHVNDIYGHSDGDLLIQTCSNIIRDNIPPEVKSYRYGGDEIVMVFKNTTLKEAKVVVDRLRECFMGQKILCTNERTGEQKFEDVSMCFGASCSLEDEFDELIDLADSRMMVQKELHYQQEGVKKYR